MSQTSLDEVKHGSTCKNQIFGAECYSDDASIPGIWGTYELEDDEKKPVVRLFTYEDLTLTDQEAQGILTERIVAACSSYLDRCPEIGKYVLCKCSLQQKGLVDISVLTYHHYLQFLDLSHNHLTDLSPLGQMPFLMHLDVSHNSLTDLLNFEPPFNLTYVDYSHNKLYDIGDLSKFWSVVHLNLSHNEIFVIRGLNKLRYLQNLDLSYNLITRIENLNHLKLVTLNLESNSVTSFESGGDAGLKTLKHIKTVNVSHNCLKTLKLFARVNSIRQIIMESNQLEDLVQLTYLKDLQFLTEVNFRNNRMTLADKYLETCVHIIKLIRIIDGQSITATEKVVTINKYDPSPRVRAADEHSELSLVEQLNNFNISPTILPVDETTPCILALVGPPESKHDKLALEFYKTYSRYVKLGVHHTTRPKLEEEIEGETYYFVSEAKFKELICEGIFISASELFGYSYGLSRNEIVKAMNGKHVLVTHTNLVGAVNMKLSNLNVKLVLTLPSEDREHYKNLKEKYYYRISRQFNLIKITNNRHQGKSNVEQWGSRCSDADSEVASILTDILGYEEDPEVKAERQISIKFLDTVKTQIETVPSSEEVSWNTTTSLEDSEKQENRTDSTPDRFRSISDVEFEEEEEPCLSVLSELLADDQDSINERKRSPNEVIQNVYQEMVNVGKMYIEFHQSNPGFFCQTVYTDKHMDSMFKLEAILKDALVNSKKASHAYSYNMDPAFDDMISERLKNLNEDIRWAMDLSLKNFCKAENEDI